MPLESQPSAPDVTLCPPSADPQAGTMGSDQTLCDRELSAVPPTLPPDPTLVPPEPDAPVFVDPTLVSPAESPPAAEPSQGRLTDYPQQGATAGPASLRATQRQVVGEATQGPGAAPAPSGGEVRTAAGYAVLKELGRGGMGVVYKAVQPGLNRQVALKMILGRGRGSKTQREQFRLEAEVIARLHHPNIVQIYEIGEQDGSPFFSLEFVEGGCLAERVAREKPTPRQAARLVEALAEGVDAAHCKGVVHRDLKPANVLLAGKPDAPLDELVPKITDFGLAKLVQDAEVGESGGIMGTPSYMPPEQAEGRTWQVGPPADIYALGAVLYDLLTGKPPFRGQTVAETLKLVVREQPRPPLEINPGIPVDLQAICLKCLQKDPAHRYRSARDLAADLRAYLHGEPISARHCSAWERTWKWARRRPAVAALLAVSVLGVLGFGAGGVALARQHAEVARQHKQIAAEQTARRVEAEEHARKEEALRLGVEQERDRAEANFTEARAATDELSALGHQRLAGVPQMEPVRRELLEKALAFHERFLAINGDRPGQRRQLGLAQLRVGEIQEQLGRQVQAEAAYRRALALFTGLAEDSAARPEDRRCLAATWNDLGILQQALRQPKEAESSFAAALALKAELVTAAPEKSEYVRELANGHNNRGHLRLSVGRTKEAEEDYAEALRLLTKLPRRDCLEDLGRTYNNLGAARLAARPAQTAEAAEAFEKAVACWAELHQANGAEPRYRHELGTSHLNHGTLAMLRGEKPGAETDYRTAIALWQRLASEYPGALAYREALANAYQNYGQLLREQSRYRDAEQVWRDAVAAWRRLAEDFPKQPLYAAKQGKALNEQAVALASTNRGGEAEAVWEEAIRLQEKRVAEQPTDPDAWQDLIGSRANVAALRSAGPVLANAESAVRRLIDAQERRTRAFAGTAAFESEAAAAYQQLAVLLFRQRKADEAVPAVAEAVRHQRLALTAEPKGTGHERMLRDYELGLIELHLQAGRHAEARRALEELLRDCPADRTQPSRLAPEQAALLLARCLEAARRDPSLSDAERQRAMNDHAAQAVAFLRLAAQQGFREAGPLRSQPEFQPLRGRDDFKRLIEELERRRDL
jgi:tetratricopeptide (TPR) repeat protein